MISTTIAIDLAKTVFELAVADADGNVFERKRLSRTQLHRYFDNREVGRVIMEACGTAHYWGRWFAERGIAVTLLPPLYVRAYVRRNKTNRSDATALLEAARASDIVPVRVKSVEQQALQGLHRVRSGWRATVTARINCLRGLCREFGINAPLGAKRGLAELSRQLEDDNSAVPTLLRSTMRGAVAEIRSIEESILQVEAELAQIARGSEVCERLQKIPGIGLLGATAIVGSVGDIRSFRSPRRFASWLGLTPKEYSSGTVRHLGSISKRGDKYLRMILVHGARAVVYSARAAERAGRPLDALRDWALKTRARSGNNKAAVAVANKLARIVWASWYRERDFEFRAPVLVAAA
jgi:transposase